MFDVTVPRAAPQGVAVKVSPTSGSVMLEQTVIGVSSFVVLGVTSEITGLSLTGVTVIGTLTVSHFEGLPLSQTITQTVSCPL